MKTFLRLLGLAILFSGLTTFSLSSQNSGAKIAFDAVEYDFGNIYGTDGPVDCEFTFVNQGALPLIISNVKTSCRCTSPEWTKEPLMPGRSGSIKVEYNPKGFSGAFNKSITVTSNAENSIVTLKIKGSVIGTKTPTDNFVYSIGELKLESLHAKFGSIYKGSTQIKNIEINNGSDKPMKLSFINLPAYLTIKVNPEEIQGGANGKLEITYNTNLSNSWEYKIDRIEVLINGKALPPNVLSVTAELKEDFSGLTAEDLANAPKIVFDTNIFNFGTLEQNKTISHEYSVKNEGKSKLIIHKVSASCGCTIVNSSKYNLEPGESTTIKAQFNSTGKLGDQKYAITVISNDPKNSKVILKLLGVVEVEGEK